MLLSGGRYGGMMGKVLRPSIGQGGSLVHCEIRSPSLMLRNAHSRFRPKQTALSLSINENGMTIATAAVSSTMVQHTTNRQTSTPQTIRALFKRTAIRPL
ncbi:hypothetical protein AG1IA_04008 [Rhizoctonia solani AG-1 IA]|uniref:Uncharacterized protein n=1 Tax=Thanatephorus cucumeris (strain AG1-IA) TaxID=983506 RepID=L8WYW6_THACA|nr:hypothetical protein AG1IA_04008 [Rhizoctonia solani AG-1 IA]